MKKEKSCGAVLYFRSKDRILFLIEKMNKGHYALVKGHVEGEETEVETALREIKEETGLDAKIDTSFRLETEYAPAIGVMKKVVYFIGELMSQEAIPQVEEVKEILFLPFAEAYSILTYENDKSILKAAAGYMDESE
ncbi:MAG TPA: NUDIX domain-containing protein [Bacilli bacterium]|nr:NUDIX domain-containing protein [Bacilli bacterium]